MNPMMYSISTLLVAIISIQIGASLAKQLFPILGVINVTMLRLSLAAIMLWVFFRPWKTALSTKETVNIALYGASLVTMNFCFYMAIARIPLGVAVALEFCGPLAVALISGRRATDFLWVLLATIGIFLFMPSLGVHDLDISGEIFALLAGIAWAFYIVFGKRASKTISEGKAAALGMSVGAFLMLPIALINGHSFSMDTRVGIYTLMVALFSSALPYSLEMISLKRLPKPTFSILMSLEPAFATLTGYLFLGENLTLTRIIAITCIMLASLGTSLSVILHKVQES